MEEVKSRCLFRSIRHIEVDKLIDRSFRSIEVDKFIEDVIREILNNRSVVGEHTVYPPCPPCEFVSGIMPASATLHNNGTFDYGEFMRLVRGDRLIDINQLEISESSTIDSTKLIESIVDNYQITNTNIIGSTNNTSEEHCTGKRKIGFLLPSYPKAFMCYVRDSLLNIPPMYHKTLLGLCGSYLISQMENTAAPFENFQLKRPTNAPPQPLLLTFGEAFEVFFPEITHITKFLLCIILTAVLIFRLHPGVQIILCMFLLIPAFFFCLLELAHNASKTGVSCGSIKLPMFWFTTLAAVGISIMFMLATLLLFNISWRLSKGKPRVEDASLDVLSKALQG